MVLGLLAAGAGTGLSMYGAQKKKKALRGAENQYMARVQQLMADQRANSLNAMGQQGELSSQHNADLSGALGNWMGAEQNAGPTSYSADASKMVNQLRGQTQEQNPYNAQSGASQGAIAQESSHANNNLSTALSAGASQDQQRRVGHLRENALMPYTAGEMSRSSKLQRLQQQFQLRNAMLQNGFSLDNNRLQNDMNAAGKSGDHALMWGSLMQQLGGSSMYGGYGAGQETGAQDPGQANSNVENGGWAGYDYTQGSPDGTMYA